MAKKKKKQMKDMAAFAGLKNELPPRKGKRNAKKKRG